MAILNISTFLSVSCVILVCVSKYGSARATVSSFETNYGIFDCVDIYKQPAFDNQLLKNHKLQRSPSHLPVIQEKTPLEQEQGWVGYPINGTGIECPEGTVPIRRAAKGDPITRNSSVGLHDYDPFTSKAPNTYYAVLKLKKMNKPYLLARATISLHRPDGRTGASGAQIWMYGGDGGSSNYVSVGWMVDRDLYGDEAAHYTMTWKGDGNTGCANTQCPGYVQTHKGSPPGLLVPVVSSPKCTYYITFYIYQDLESKNWWLAVDSVKKQALVPIGYWPKELFSGIKDGASQVAFGGVARAKPPVPSPPMGSGTADCNFDHTAFFRRVNYIVDAGHFVQPDWSMTETHVDCPDGYSVHNGCKKRGLPDFGFTYGGKGGC